MGAIAGELVSIVLPCHDAESFLPEALDSVLAQTHREIEVVAIDDGSEDGTGEILRSAAARDDRVRALSNEGNRGLIQTLNRAVAEARGSFIARMDADDVLALDRIERQLAVLAAQPEISVVGSAALVIDEAGRVVGRLPVRCTAPSAAAFLALFATPLMHPTIMAREDVMRAFPYRDAPESLHVEDYDLFTRMLSAGARLANLDHPLYRKRTHAARVSSRFEPLQVANFLRLARLQLERTLGVRLSDGVHRVLVNRMDGTTSFSELRNGLRWLNRLRDLGLQDLVDDGDDVKAEVRAIADQQRVDILGQAILKGPVRRRLAGIALLARYSLTFTSPKTWRYVREKVVRPLQS